MAGQNVADRFLKFAGYWTLEIAGIQHVFAPQPRIRATRLEVRNGCRPLLIWRPWPASDP
jgi:hypothetical protein